MKVKPSRPQPSLTPSQWEEFQRLLPPNTPVIWKATDDTGVVQPYDQHSMQSDGIYLPIKWDSPAMHTEGMDMTQFHYDLLGVWMPGEALIARATTPAEKLSPLWNELLELLLVEHAQHYLRQDQEDDHANPEEVRAHIIAFVQRLIARS